MNLKPGRKPYEHQPGRPPLMVKVKGSNRIGTVEQATPAGRNIPPQAYVVYWPAEGEPYNTWSGYWYPTSTLQKVYQ